MTVATPGDVATVELSPGGANVMRGERRRAHEPLPRAAAARPDTNVEESPSTIPRLEVVRSQPLLDALRSHDGHPKGVCRHVDEREPWVDQTETVASVVMNLATCRLHVAAASRARTSTCRSCCRWRLPVRSHRQPAR